MATITKFEDALDAMIVAFESIQTGSGYQTDVKSVKREYKLPHDAPDSEFNFIGIAHTDRKLIRPEDGVSGLAAWDWVVRLHVFALASNGGAELSRIEAGIAQALGAYGSAENKLGGAADWCDITRVRQFTELKPEAMKFVMSAVEITVRIEHETGDATQ